MECILTFLSVVLGTGKNIISKLGNNYFSNVTDCMKLNTVTSLLGCVVFGLTAGGRFSGEKNTIFFVLSFLYGLCTLFSQVFYIAAVKDGAVSICSLIYSCGFIIPTIFAAIFFKETVTLLKIIGILLLTACTVTAGYKKEKTKEYKWIAPACLAMLSSGGVGVLQKIVRNSYSQWNMDEYLFFAFAFMFFLSCLGIVTSKGKSNGYSAKYAVYTMLLSACVAGANKLNLYLSGVLSGVVFFPCVNGGCLIASALMSGVIFKERFGTKKIIAISGSIIAIILVSCG